MEPDYFSFVNRFFYTLLMKSTSFSLFFASKIHHMFTLSLIYFIDFYFAFRSFCYLMSTAFCKYGIMSSLMLTASFMD